MAFLLSYAESILRAGGLTTADASAREHSPASGAPGVRSITGVLAHISESPTASTNAP